MCIRLTEFGLLAGALGRHRTFLILPKHSEISIPSDLLGLIPATYGGDRIQRDLSQVTSAVQVACTHIKDLIRREWDAMLSDSEELASKLRASLQGQAIKRLYQAVTQFRNVPISLEGNIVELLTPGGVDRLKDAMSEKVREIGSTFHDDAVRVGVEGELDALISSATDAIRDLPVVELKAEFANLGIQFLGRLLNQDHNLELKERFSEWWSDHSRRIQRETNNLHDALFDASMNLTCSLVTMK